MTNSEDITIQEALRQCVMSAMQELGISRAELARKLGVSRAAVTQMFDEGWTIERFQQIVETLGAKISIKLTLPSEADAEAPTLENALRKLEAVSATERRRRHNGNRGICF